MFKRHSLEMKVVKTPRNAKPVTEPTAALNPTTNWIEKIKKDDVVRATVGAVAVYASVKAVNTLSTIAINYCPKN